MKIKNKYSHRLQLASRRNTVLISRLVIILLSLILINSWLFKYIMESENHYYSWITSFYWTISNMSTLGLGDITFESDLGRFFNIVASLSGLVYIFVLFPYTFVKLFQSTERIHRDLRDTISDHIILAHFDHISSSLIKKLKQYRIAYVLVVPELKQASELMDMGFNVVSSEMDDQETFEKVNINKSLGVVLTGNHFSNTSITYAVRQKSNIIPIVSTADSESASEVLYLAGASNVIRPGEMLGRLLARRITAGNALAHNIGEFGQLKIAEATVKGTPLVNKTLSSSKLRELSGVSVVGIWEKGSFSTVNANTIISERSVLVLAGSQDQIDQYNEIFCIYNISVGEVIIIGGGVVGKTLGKTLEEKEISYKIIEKNPDKAISDKYLVGDASDKEFLISSGIMTSPAVAITTEDDNVNIFLTTLIRNLRPDIQIISRSNLDRAVEHLYYAGCDFVISLSSMGANSIFNLLKKGNILMIAEGVDIFKVDSPKKLIGKTIMSSTVREKTGCSIVAITSGDEIKINPEPTSVIEKGKSIVLIGNAEAETKFFNQFSD